MRSRKCAVTYDGDGDGTVDRLQTIAVVTNGDGSKTGTLINKIGSVAATAVLVNWTLTTTSADTKVVTIERDTMGGRASRADDATEPLQRPYVRVPRSAG